MLIMKQMIDKYKAVCFVGTLQRLSFVKWLVETIRSLQPNPIILFIDEVDRMIRHQEEEFLPFLDGTESVDRLIMLGCTNNLEDIPGRIKDRKSRIRHLFLIDALPMDVYKQYIIEKVPALGAEIISEFAYKAVEKKLTIDQLKNALIDYRIEGISIDVAIEGVKISTDEQDQPQG